MVEHLRAPLVAVVLALLVLTAGACTAGQNDSDDGNGSNSAEGAEGTPIEVTADVTVGRLDNGLDYYIMDNDSPGGQAQLLLVVDAGSAQQEVPDSGAAHFLEHMMFNGTEEFPGNEIDAVLRRLGVEIGPDLNAYTSFDETVYQLGMPAVRNDDLELGLRVLAQWAGAATIDQQEVEAERGVVREEYRVRTETGSAAVNQRLFEIYSQDSGYEGHLPIGSEERILDTNAEELRRFYDDWYRPDNMAVIAVGDIDVGEVEALIKQELSDVTDRGSTPERQPVEAEPLTEPIVEVVTRDDGPEPSISLDYQLANRNPATVEGQRLLLADELIAMMLNDYLDELAADGDLDIVRPFVQPFEFTRSRRFLGLNVAAADYAQGATDLMRAMATAQERGFTDQHLDQARQRMRSTIAQTVASDDTKQDAEWADEMVAHVLTGRPLDSIEAWEERMNEQLDSLELDELNEIFASQMAETAPLFTLLGSDPTVLPDQAELEAAVDAGMNGDLVAEREAVAIDRLVDRPDGPEPTDEGEIWGFAEDRFWRFDNGASVLFWNSSIAANQVDVWLFSPSGRQDLSESESRLASSVVTAVTNSGVAGFDQVSVDRYLASTPVSLSPFVDLRWQGMSGSVASDNLATLFELINAYYTEPQVNRAGQAVAGNELEATLQGIDTDPGFASAVAERSARFADQPNLIGIPTEETSVDGDADELLDIFQGRFSTAEDLVVIVVGDTDPDTVEDLASDFIGSLPAGRPDPDGTSDTGGYPTGPTSLEVDAGLNDSGAGFDRYYQRPGILTPADSIHADLLVGIINDRLFARIREELGASYGGGRAAVLTGPLNSFDTSFSISVNGDPARLDEIETAVDEELQALLADGPTEDDLAEAKAVLSNDVQLINNVTLMSYMLDFHVTGQAGTLFAEERLIEAATGDDIRRIANTLMDPADLIQVTRQPGG